MAAAEVDDPSIENDWRLLKRIPIAVDGVCPHIVWDKNLNEWIISSVAFNAHPANLRAFSVHLEPVLIENPMTAASVLLDAEKFALAAFTAGQARAAAQVINRDPRPVEPAHAHVLGDKKKSIRKALRDYAVWVISPPAQVGYRPAT